MGFEIKKKSLKKRVLSKKKIHFTRKCLKTNQTKCGLLVYLNKIFGTKVRGKGLNP